MFDSMSPTLTEADLREFFQRLDAAVASFPN